MVLLFSATIGKDRQPFRSVLPRRFGTMGDNCSTIPLPVFRGLLFGKFERSAKIFGLIRGFGGCDVFPVLQKRVTRRGSLQNQ